MRTSTLIVFDMDDTLYPEMTYAESGLRFVGNELEVEHGIRGICDHLLQSLHSGVRGTIFNKTLSHFDLPESLVPSLVQRYRSHAPSIQLYPDAPALLARLRSHTHLALITDGPLVCQKAKIEALDLESEFELLVCTDEWGKAYWKPHERSYLYVMQHFRVAPERICYIGDNPTKDFVTPRQLGWKTIRVDRIGHINPVMPPSDLHEADVVVSDLASLWPYLLPLFEA